MATIARNFSLTKPRYDPRTFGGRFKNTAALVDSRTLLPRLFFGISLAQAQDLLAQFKAGTLPPTVSDDQLWTARNIVSATVHPDTGKPVPWMFRLAGYNPIKGPILIGLLFSSPRVNVAFQLIHQAHNAAMNYFNRNASKPMSNAEIIKGFVLATTSSLGVILGVNKFVASRYCYGLTKTIVTRVMPFATVGFANAINAVGMRLSELKSGINVQDEQGKVLGVSKLAAKRALKQTFITKFLQPAPALLGPAIAGVIMDVFTPKIAPSKKKIIITGISVLGMFIGLPLATAVFPRVGAVSADKLEPQFRNLKTSTGAPITSLFYNKGL